MDQEMQRARLTTRLALQSGVVRRAQILELGYDDNAIEGFLRRRELVRECPGVYVDHTGRLTWDQRSWVAVLACWPAALRGASARRSAGSKRDLPDDGAPIEVVVDASRRPRGIPGVDIRRTRRFAGTVDWSAYPPRQQTAEWVLDLASAAPRIVDAVAVIVDTVGARQVRPSALRAALAARPRLARRRLLAGVIDDAEAGTHSVLEHGYLTLVERAHGLPAGERQLEERITGAGRRPLRRMFRDVVYRAFGLIVELDGLRGHTERRDRDKDLERDLIAAVSGRRTVRLGWAQVFDRPCSTAAQIATMLTQGGWSGALRRCPRCP